MRAWIIKHGSCLMTIGAFLWAPISAGALVWLALPNKPQLGIALADVWDAFLVLVGFLGCIAIVFGPVIALGFLVKDKE